MGRAGQERAELPGRPARARGMALIIASPLISSQAESMLRNKASLMHC